MAGAPPGRGVRGAVPTALSGEKVRISDKAERVQSVSYSHISIVRVIYSGVFEGRQARHLTRAPVYNCNV